MEHVVFLLDLDGTLQGDINPQVKEYEFMRALNSRILGKKIKYNLEYLYEDMDMGLIRPHMVNTIRQICQKHKNVDFYVYTASSDIWGNFVVRNIKKRYFEKENGFNTDIIFTRTHCKPSVENNTIVLRKSISQIKPLILNSLSNKYKTKIQPLIYLVDNNYVLFQNENKNLIHCPTYNYKVISSPLRNVPTNILRKHKSLISTLLTIDIDYMEVRLRNERMKQKEINSKERKDVYWKTFGTIMMKTRFKTKTDIVRTVSKLKRI
jgi:hypothetical protein